MKYIFYIFCASILILSCGKTEQSVEPTAVLSDFFDLHSYTVALIERYTEQEVRVNKKVSLNDNSELLENLEVDWKTEFQPLLQAHIKRSAWIDKFRVDTLKNEKDYVVLYQTGHPSIPVRQLEVTFDNGGDVQSIRIETRRKNLLYNSKQVIVLEPDVRYRVEGSQRALFLSRTAFNVDSYILMEQDADQANQGE